MIYADYVYYLTTHMGSLPEEDFIRLSRRASAYIEGVTFGRSCTEDFGAVKSKLSAACCALVDEMYRQERGGSVSSETVGRWSRTYVADGKSAERRLYDIAIAHIGQTGLMYQGG